MRHILIILIFSPILAFSQTNSKIESTASKLTGTWLLERYERDSLVRTQQIVNNKFIEETYVLGKLTGKEESKGGYVIELSFNPNGKGSHQEYYEYELAAKDDDFIEINTCQPVPELKIRNGKIYIHMTYMMGEGEEEILQLTTNSLELLNDDGIRRTFKRIK